MSAQSELWAAVVVSYDSASLITLTNIHDRSATSITTAVGEDAALGVINLWPIYAQVVYDSTNDLHVEIGKRAAIAMLWERGGSASVAAKQEGDEVFTDSVLNMLKRTGARGRQGPNSNSGVQQKSELTSSGGKVRGWSDRECLPGNYLPIRRTALED